MAECASAELYYDPLECTICLGSYQDPKLLPCFHSFCLVCLEKHVKEDTVPASRYNLAYFTCPLCRKETDIPSGGVKSFQTNFYIDALRTDSVGNDFKDRQTVNAVCGELGSVDLHLGVPKPELGQRGQELYHAQNHLAEIRFGAAKYAKYLSDLKQGSGDYARTLMCEVTELRKEIQKTREEAHSLVNSACDEVLSLLEDTVKVELDRCAGYEAKMDAMILETETLAEKAEACQMQGRSSAISETLAKLKDGYTKMLGAVPAKFGEKKTLSLQKPAQPLHQRFTTGIILGKVFCQNVAAPVQVQKPMQPSQKVTGGQECSHSDSNVQVADSNTGGSKTNARPKEVKDQLCDKAPSEASFDSDSSSLEVEFIPSLEFYQELHGVQAVHGAVGGAEVGVASSSLLEPKVVRLFDAPVSLDIKHITPHTTSRQAWVNFGQREPTVYLFDVDGHHIRMVSTGGDAHDITVLDENTLVVANPAQRRVRQVDVDPDESPNMPGHHTYFLPFSATCVAYSDAIKTLAVAGKNNMLILSTISGQTQKVVQGSQDFLSKPSSVAFSRISDYVVLAAADLGTKRVCIFVERNDENARFTRDDMFTYQGEGLHSHGEHCNFQPVSVCGRDDLLAVLDRTTDSIALLGQEFSLIGIVRLNSLGVPSPRCLAFTSDDSSCWQVWLGTAVGKIAVVDLPLPEFCGLV